MIFYVNYVTMQGCWPAGCAAQCAGARLKLRVILDKEWEIPLFVCCMGFFMGKIKVKELIPELLGDFLEQNGLELFNVEFVKEGKERFLRVYIDKPQNPDGSDSYIDTDECEKVSRYLSDKLDGFSPEDDPIKEKYTLEVSSPGLDRPLIHDADFERYAGRLVDVSTYAPCEAINGQKQITAELLGLFENTVRLKDESSADTIEIQRDMISKICLAVVF